MCNILPLGESDQLQRLNLPPLNVNSTAWAYRAKGRIHLIGRLSTTCICATVNTVSGNSGMGMVYKCITYKLRVEKGEDESCISCCCFLSKHVSTLHPVFTRIRHVPLLSYHPTPMYSTASVQYWKAFGAQEVLDNMIGEWGAGCTNSCWEGLNL